MIVCLGVIWYWEEVDVEGWRSVIRQFTTQRDLRLFLASAPPVGEGAGSSPSYIYFCTGWNIWFLILRVWVPQLRTGVGRPWRDWRLASTEDPVVLSRLRLFMLLVIIALYQSSWKTSWCGLSKFLCSWFILWCYLAYNCVIHGNYISLLVDSE